MRRISKVAHRYGHVFYTLAHEKKSETIVLSNLESLASLIEKNASLENVFRNPLVTRQETEKIVTELSTVMKFDGITQSFLKVLAAQKRLNDLLGILEAYKIAFNKHCSKMIATVSSRYPLSQLYIDRLSVLLKEKTGHQVEVKTLIDSSLLGGIVIRIGSYMIDASVRTKLNKLKYTLERVA